MPTLLAVSHGKDFEDPPSLRQFQLVEERTQRVRELLFLLRFETGRCRRRSLHFVDECVVSRLCLVVGGLLECGYHGCIRREGLGPREHEGIECSGIEADVPEGFTVELDSSVGAEAFADHPTKWNPGQAVPGTIRDRSTTDVYTTDGCQYQHPSMLLRD